MKTIKFSNLIDTKTGETLEIEVPDNFDPTTGSFAEAGRRGSAFGKRFAKIAKEVDRINKLERQGKTKPYMDY